MNSSAQKSAPQLGRNTIAEVIKAMTLEEKTKLVVGKGFSMPGAPAAKGEGPTIGQTRDRVPGAAGSTYAIPRLGIPTIVVSDGPAGVRIDTARDDQPGKVYYATAWPVGTLLASSWDTALVERVGQAFGQEVKEYGIDILLGPAMNIHRNPLGGRNFEYYSEDPLVSGLIAASMVNGIESNGVGTSIKHFAANNQETNRNTINTFISERALREIYLRGFEIAVKKAQPWTVMSSYNLINGTYTSESHALLTTILRDEWGFNGAVMTDWFGGKDPVAQMKAGNDLLMPGTPDQSKAILQAVKSGRLKESVLDTNIARLLKMILQSPTFKGYKYSDQPDLTGHAQLAREAAGESMVLLKNEGGALPLGPAGAKIALFGIDGYALIAGGTGSGNVNKAYSVSLAQGLSGAGYSVDAQLAGLYDFYLKVQNAKRPKKSILEEFVHPTPPIPEFGVEDDVITRKAGESDLAIVCVGRNAGEGNDRKVADDYELTETELHVLNKVADVFHAAGKKLIVVLNTGGVIDVVKWREKADGILLAWQPGMEGGNAIADLLTGKVNPSGKLATSFPMAYKDVPSAKNFPGKEFPEKARTGFGGMRLVPGEVTYEEGIYVGYRYYSTYGVKTAYPFGYGLSYTSFGYSDLQLGSATFRDKLTVQVKVSNTGKVAGKEVVQLYLSAPSGGIDKPAAELKAFGKTGLLQPGESQTLSFTLDAKDLASFHTAQSAWIADRGQYTVKIGASSADIRLSQTFRTEQDIVVERVHKVMAPTTPIREMTGAVKKTMP